MPWHRVHGASSLLLARAAILFLALFAGPAGSAEAYSYNGKQITAPTDSLSQRIINIANSFMGIMTSKWLSGFLAVAFIALVLVWLNNRQDQEFQGRVFGWIMGVVLINCAPSIALIIYHPSGALR